MRKVGAAGGVRMRDSWIKVGLRSSLGPQECSFWIKAGKPLAPATAALLRSRAL